MPPPAGAAARPVKVAPPVPTTAAPPASIPSATPAVLTRPTPTSAPAQSPPPRPAEIPVTGAQGDALPYREQALPARDETDLHALLLGVGHVERTAAGQTIWAFVYNGTAKTQRVSLRHHLRDAQGRETDCVAYCPPGRAASLPGGHLLYLWPTFRPAAESGERQLEFSVDVEGYGRLRVPVVPQVTNLGGWDELPANVRDVLADAFKSDGAFQWWGD